MWEHGETMGLPHHRVGLALNRECPLLAIGFLLLFLLGACKHPSESVEYAQPDPQGALLVSECAIHGSVAQDFLRVQLINTGQVAFSVPTTGTNRELFVDPVGLQVSRWSDGRFCTVGNYWELPLFGGGEIGLRRLSPGEMIAGVLKLKEGAQYSLKEGRYLGVLRYDLGTWSALLAAPEIDKMHLTASFLFVIPSSGEASGEAGGHP